MSRIVRRLDTAASRPWSPPGLGNGAAGAGEPAPAVNPELERGYEDGFKEGREAGLAAARDEMKSSLDVLASMLSNAARPLAFVDEVLEDELTRLAIAIAKQVIRRELHTDPNQVAAVVREVRKSLGAVTGKLRINAHPDDAAVIRRLFTDHEELSSVQIEDDPSIQRGGCTVFTDASFVDATVETRIARIAVQLLGDERGGADHAEQGARA